MTSSSHPLIASLLAIAAVTFPLTANAAEELTIVNGIGRRSISAESLQTYASTGEADGTLGYFVRGLSDERETALRRSLQEEIEVDFLPFVNFLKSDLGSSVLQELAEGIEPAAPTVSGEQALRAALIGSAVDGKIVLTELIARYPTQTLVLDWKDIRDKAQLFETTGGNFQQFLAASGIEVTPPSGFGMLRSLNLLVLQPTDTAAELPHPSLFQSLSLYRALNQLRSELTQVMAAFAPQSE
ncbi:alpha/beta hydrolase [Synechococcus sp. PCC 7336]|uniref:alpha/beta hydrolase n=1 Tax=Synechococcus sp. PCC 7336 TaxID=195250 RepID=UPI00034CA854|nr:alpha/beta hydrolase [Synechococcus sp. PCC 7336]